MRRPLIAIAPRSPLRVHPGKVGTLVTYRVVFVTLAFAMLALAGCSDANEPVGGVRTTESDSAGITIVQISGSVQDLPLWQLDTVPVTEISGNAAPFLGAVGEVALLSDGRLLVEDDQTAELRQFDATGAELRLLGGHGEGPGEFQNLTELTVTSGDTSYTYDRRLYRISRFAADGSLLGTLNVGRERAGPGSLVLDAFAVDSEHLILHSLGTEQNPNTGRAYSDQRDAVLHVLDGDGTVVGAALHFTGGYSIAGAFGDATAPFANRPIVSVGAGHVLTGSGISYGLVVRTPDLQPVRIVRWPGWQQPLGDELVQAVRDTLEAGFEPLRVARPDVFSTLMEALFDSTLLPDTLPAIGRALLDDTGRIWVAAFRPTTFAWREEDMWHVLSPGGEPLARLQLPSSAQLLAVRGDRIALVVRDESDVEHVRVFQVVQGAAPRN